MRRTGSDLAPIRREVRSRADRWYDVRLRPYRTVDDRMMVVVITFVDISDRARSRRRSEPASNTFYTKKQLIDLSREPILVWIWRTASCNGTAAVRGSMASNEWRRSDTAVKSLLGTTVPGSSFEQVKSTLRERGNWPRRTDTRTRDGASLRSTAGSSWSRSKVMGWFLKVLVTFTERKQWSRAEIAATRADHRVKNTLAVVQAMLIKL